jgi:hypothetical protein
MVANFEFLRERIEAEALHQGEDSVIPTFEIFDGVPSGHRDAVMRRLRERGPCSEKF